MILVDIQVPDLDRIYDFELDETLPVEQLTETITEMICRRERLTNSGNEKMYLLALKRGKVLNGANSLKEQGILDGERLLLI